MITKEQIQERISKLNSEKAVLESMHAALVGHFQKVQNEFQQQITENQVRYQQISGAISHLSELMNSANGSTPPTGNA